MTLLGMRFTSMSFVAVAVFILLLTATEACTVSQFEVAEKEGLPPYSFLLFYKPGNPASEKSLVVLRELEQIWTNRANVVFESIDVDTPNGRNMAVRWEVQSYPTTYVMAPTGWIAGFFTNNLSKAVAKALISSPGKAALREALKKHKVVFLVLGNKTMKGYEETIKATGKAVKSVKEFMHIDAGVLAINPKDERERNLLLNMGLNHSSDSATVYVAYGKGRAVLRPIESDDLAAELAFRVQLLGTADQCSLGMEIFGEPLLLGK
jgi:hypothetical protein